MDDFSLPEDGSLVVSFLVVEAVVDDSITVDTLRLSGEGDFLLILLLNLVGDVGVEF